MSIWQITDGTKYAKRHEDNSRNHAGLWLLEIAILAQPNSVKFLVKTQRKVPFRNTCKLKERSKRTVNAKMSRTRSRVGLSISTTLYEGLSNSFLKVVNNQRFNQSDHDTRIWYYGVQASVDCLFRFVHARLFQTRGKPTLRLTSVIEFCHRNEKLLRLSDTVKITLLLEQKLER